MSGVSLNWWSHSEIRINMQIVNKIDRIIKQQKWEVWGLTEKKGKKSILKTTEVWQAVAPMLLLSDSLKPTVLSVRAWSDAWYPWFRHMADQQFLCREVERTGRVRETWTGKGETSQGKNKML